MTVAPRYQAYDDAADTGITVPVDVCSSHPTRAQQYPRHSFGLAGSQAPARTLPNVATVGLQTYARLFHHKAEGVDRVFVDHPLFLQQRNGSASTYLEATDAPSLDLQYSILCQAALAAPVLIWHQPRHHLAALQQQAIQRSCPQTLSGGLVQLISCNGSPQPRELQPMIKLNKARHAAIATASASASGGVAHALGAAEAAASLRSQSSQYEQMRQWLATETPLDSQELDVIWPESAGKIAFVGNDWPCAPLAQHLSYLQSLDDPSPAINEGHTDEPPQPAHHPLAPAPQQDLAAAMRLHNLSAAVLLQDGLAAVPISRLPGTAKGQHTMSKERAVTLPPQALLQGTSAAAVKEQLVAQTCTEFQAQLARLIKSARVAFCIHNMAQQGLFPQVPSAPYRLHIMICSMPYLQSGCFKQSTTCMCPAHLQAAHVLSS